MRKINMSVTKQVAVLGLIVAFAAPAGAAIIPFSQPYTGALVWHITNWEDAVVYDYNNGFLADNVTPITIGTAYPAGQVKVLHAGRGTTPGETSWGIFQVDQIMTAAVTGRNSISPDASTLYNKGESNTDIVGIFYGGSDLTVTFNSSVLTTIVSTGTKYEVFTQPKGIYESFVTPALGAGARVDLNEYPKVGYDGTGSNTLMAGAERVLTATGQPGMTSKEFLTTFDTSQRSGTFDTYFSLNPLAEAFDSSGASAGFSGTQNVQFNADIFPCGGFVPFIPGTTADFRIKGTTEPTNFDWLARSSDPMTTEVIVPEPATLGLLALGGLALLRRRRTA